MATSNNTNPACRRCGGPLTWMGEAEGYECLNLHPLTALEREAIQRACDRSVVVLPDPRDAELASLRRELAEVRGILPAPEPRCVVTNWGYRCGKPYQILSRK